VGSDHTSVNIIYIAKDESDVSAVGVKSLSSTMLMDVNEVAEGPGRIDTVLE
jgi:hypothetical protein